MNQLSDVATSLIEYCAADGRVCPRGDKWHELWKMLPEDLTKTGRGRTAPLPLILAAIECEPWEKRMRVKDHIVWADAHGVIGQIDSFLRGVSPEEWERSTSSYIKEDFYDRHMFQYRIDDDDVEGMKIYLSKGIDPNDVFAEHSNGNALVRAAEAGAINAIAYLLTAGAKLDSLSAGVAAAQGRNDILDLLLDAGLVPDADALCTAAGTSNVQGVERLLRAGAPVNDLTSFGWYALHNATMEGQTEVVESMLKSGANPDVAMRDGTTPLMIAAHGGHIPIVELLLKYGADPLRRNELGETALDQAKESNHQVVVTILESFVNK